VPKVSSFLLLAEKATTLKYISTKVPIMQLPEKVCFRKGEFAECLSNFSRLYHLLMSMPSSDNLREAELLVPKVEEFCHVDLSDVAPYISEAYVHFVKGDISGANLNKLRALSRLTAPLAEEHSKLYHERLSKGLARNR